MLVASSLRFQNITYPVTAPLVKDLQGIYRLIKSVKHVPKAPMDQGGKSSITGEIGLITAQHLPRNQTLLRIVKLHVIMSEIVKLGKQAVSTYFDVFFIVLYCANSIKLLVSFKSASLFKTP